MSTSFFFSFQTKHTRSWLRAQNKSEQICHWTRIWPINYLTETLFSQLNTSPARWRCCTLGQKQQFSFRYAITVFKLPVECVWVTTGFWIFNSSLFTFRPERTFGDFTTVSVKIILFLFYSYKLQIEKHVLPTY